MNSYRIAAFYRFTPLGDIPALRTLVLEQARILAPDVCGTILLAPEGINGTIGAPPEQLAALIAFLDAQTGLCQGEVKYSGSQAKPFNRFKVRPKKEIITMKKPEANPATLTGTYVAPEDWNTLLTDPEVVLIDTRNTYETDVGIFRGAIDPRLSTFSEFPDWVDKALDPKTHRKVAMFCTGGIRCEKASAYMRAQGFENVYHLKGGILKYLETISADESLWDGECFVFDKRVAVGHGLTQGEHEICYGCRAPLTPQDRMHADYEEGVSCPRCAQRFATKQGAERAAAFRARHKDFTRREDA